MKRGTIASILGTVAVAGFGFTASAEVKENPYQVIIDRNAFGLRPIPPPPEPKKEEAPPVPPPDIKLTGITDLLGAPRVMLQVEDKQAKDPTKKFSFPIIAEGDSDPGSGIFVVSIDMENMRARIRNGDAETTLDFKNNGVKPGGAVASAVPHPGVVPLVRPLGVPQPPVAPAEASSIAGRSAIISGGAPAATAAPNPALNFGGSMPVPARPLRTDSLSIMAGGGNQVYNPNPQPALQQQPGMTQVEAEARIEAARRMIQERQAAGQVVPHSPNILPPTTLGRAAGPVPPPPGP
ncbi:MAG TPA: hypothetical protein VNT99_18500 [Methylomirabilota bacterium]|nr:hypothetical protein [Methylomirabilota bacterium]